MTVKMTEGGEKVAVVTTPTYLVTPASTEMSSGSQSQGIQKKHVLIGVGLGILTGLIIAGILVGIHIYTEAQKDIVKYSLNFKSDGDGKDVKQDVVSDPNDNSVMYHITKDGKSVDVVNDFNRNLQVVRMEYMSGTNCYVSALSRSAALDPSQITGPEKDIISGNASSGYATKFTVSSHPISDRSFLPKKALNMCKDTSVYWAYRSCINQNENKPNTDAVGRQRRGWYCLSGCGWTVCSCSVTLYYYYDQCGKLHCDYYVGC